MRGGANLFVKDVTPWAHFNSGVFDGFGLLVFISEKFPKKISQKSWPAQVPKLLPLASPRDPEKANTEEQQWLSSVSVPIPSSISP